MNSPAKNSLPRYDAPEAVMRSAGEWLARRDRGFSAEESSAFQSWLAADPLHTAAVGQLDRTMATFDALWKLAPEGSLDGAQAPDPDAFAPPPRRTRIWFYPSLAAAGIAAALTLVLWYRSPAPAAPNTWHYATAAAGYQRNLLPDGSTLELNGDTTVDVEFTPTERTVRLTRGEAHFSVAKNPARPFVVHTEGVAFRAVGTAFDVRLNPSSVEMLVTEGKVQVEPASSTPAPSGSSSASGPTTATSAPKFGQGDLPLITAGYRISVPSARAAQPTVVALSTEEIATATAWQPRLVEFYKAPLRDVVAEFNRHNRQQIQIADPSLESLNLGGMFRIEQPDAFVRLLESSFGIAAEHSGDVITLRKAP